MIRAACLVLLLIGCQEQEPPLGYRARVFRAGA